MASSVTLYSSNIIICYIDTEGNVRLRPMLENVNAGSTFNFSIDWLIA